MNSGHEVKICATNMSVLFQYGDLSAKLVAEGYPIDFRILSAVEGDTVASMAKSIGLLQISLVDYLQWVQPDWLILAGDRAEQLAAAVAASYCYIPTAHIQAGERSGNIDGVARHAITKFVHLHFASNEEASQRLLRMGEEPFRVHTTGAPQIDDIYTSEILSIPTLKERGVIKNGQPYFVVCFHPDTDAPDASKSQIKLLVECINALDSNSIWIMPNNDAGGHYIRDYIINHINSKSFVHTNLERSLYLSLLHHAEFLIGNSSSGILEAPSLKLPTINIGTRQDGRVQGENVINVSGLSVGEMNLAIEKARKMKSKRSIQGILSPYGDGKSSKRILTILEQTKIDSSFLQKRITY
jgi:GDP/UDP-N,N'-diacetylbacillosamine 2-epimerase (hydrolysing)